MAEVFRGRVVGAHGITKEFALKRILPQLEQEDEFIAMMVDEARILVTLDHPNIVSVHEFCRVDGHYLLVMELVRGRALSRVAARAALLPDLALGIADVLFIGSQAAAGLGYAHAHTDADGHPLGIVHRDVSPQNILVSWHGDVKVVDFGVAKAAGKINTTRGGVIKGKFAYMSPQQAQGERLDGRSDIFSLGIVLWELLTRQRLFRGDSEREVLRQVITKPIPALGEMNPQIPDRVAEIVHRAVARQPEDRYPDAESLETDLVSVLHEIHRGYTRRNLAERMAALFMADIAEEKARFLESSSKSIEIMIEGRVAPPPPPVWSEPSAAGGAAGPLPPSESQTVSEGRARLPESVISAAGRPTGAAGPESAPAPFASKPAGLDGAPAASALLQARWRWLALAAALACVCLGLGVGVVALRRTPPAPPPAATPVTGLPGSPAAPPPAAVTSRDGGRLALPARDAAPEAVAPTGPAAIAGPARPGLPDAPRKKKRPRPAAKGDPEMLRQLR